MKTLKYILAAIVLAAAISITATDALAGHSSVSVGVGLSNHGNSFGFSYGHGGGHGGPWHHGPGPYWGPRHHSYYDFRYYSYPYYDYPVVVERPVVVAQPAPVVVQQTPIVVQQAAPVIYTPPAEVGVDGRVKGQASSSQANSQPTSQASSQTTVVWVKNDNGSQTPVTLRPQGAGFIGPQNEYYSTLPTEEQLKAQYGLQSNVQAAAAAPTESVVVNIDNGNGSKTPVTLQKSGTNYIGPAGEVYTTMPTEEQLKALYGANPGASQTNLNVEITRADGTKFVVALKKEGTEFVGPKGERYPSMPTQEQLKMIYGK
jgi:hypothetical protein